MPRAELHVGLEALAFLVGGLIYWRAGNAASQPADTLTRWGVLAGAALGAALGSRLLYVAQYWTALAGEPLAVWLGGKTIVGGLLGGLAGIELAKRALGWRLSTGDGFVLPLLVAMVIGRVGCQLAGLSDLTYGNVTTLPWGWDYGDGRARHPTAFYEILALLIITWVAYRPVFGAVRGDRFRAFFTGYLLVRFGLEYLKPPFGPAAARELSPVLWGSFTAIQWACLAGLAYYSRDIWRWARQRDASRA